VWTSRQPLTRSLWTERRVEPESIPTQTVPPYPHPNNTTVQQLTCTSIAFCLGLAAPDAVSSGDPPAGAAAWRRYVTPDDNASVSSCADQRLCVIAGNVLTTGLPGQQGFTDVSVAVSHNPSATDPVWNTVAVPTAPLTRTDDSSQSPGPYACASEILRRPRGRPSPHLNGSNRRAGGLAEHCAVECEHRRTGLRVNSAMCRAR
jgi:hypothetical protein